MGTRCLTEIRSNWEGGDWETNTVIYRHWDGYPEGHGNTLLGYLANTIVTNGRRMGTPDDGKVRVNGPGRLAAYIVAAMIEDGHDPDIIGSDPVVDIGQEWHYRVNVAFGMDGGSVTVDVFSGPVTAFGHGGDECTNLQFSGTVEEYANWVPCAALSD